MHTCAVPSCTICAIAGEKPQDCEKNACREHRTLVDQDTDKEVVYTIVGEDESDVKQGKISLKSPIARALIGKHVDDLATVRTPGGEKEYEVVSVEFNS